LHPRAPDASRARPAAARPAAALRERVPRAPAAACRWPGRRRATRARARRQVPVQMELGGKDACIVCEDADLALAAANIVKGGFSYSGQRCTAVKLVPPAPGRGSPGPERIQCTHVLQV